MKKSIVHSLAFSLLLCGAGTAFGQNIYTFAGTSGTGGGYAGDGSHATLAQLTGPTGIAVTGLGIVYFCDSRNFVVRKVDASGIISTVAGNNTPGYSGDGGAATDAQLSPTAIAVDRAGNLYITDGRASVIREVNTSGTISTFAGTGTPGFSGDGGSAASAQLNRPAGIAIDTAGNIYVADSRNFVVRKINTSGVINTIAGSNVTGYSGDGAAATLATLSRPSGIAIKTDGTLYITDGGNNDVRVVAASGIINTFAGTGTAGYTGDGAAATAATLSNPVGVTIDASGNVYISDVANNVIRKVTTTGTINTYAGNGTLGFSGDGGLAIHAQLATPSWVAADASGNLYISDNANNVVRRVGSAVTSITIATAHGDTVCAGVTRHFTATAYADATPHYQWQVNGVNTGSDSTGFTYAALTTGDFINCFLLDTSGGSDIAVSNYLTVDTLPNIGTLTGITTICVGSTSIFRDSTAGGGGGFGGPPTGTWSLTNTAIATIGTGFGTSVTAISIGTDTLVYTNSNTCGTLRDTAVLTITANPNGHITGPDTLCSRATATYLDSTTGGTWGVMPRGAGFIDASGNFTAGRTRGPGNYVIITYGTSPACVSMDTVYIDSLPRIMPITGPTTVNTLFMITLTDGTPGGSWSSADTTIATVSSTGVVYGVAVGTVGISYSITNSLGCTGYFIDTITVVDASGIQNVLHTTDFTISPNPVTNSFVLSWSGGLSGNGSLAIADVTGKTFFRNDISFTNVHNLPVDISPLPAGIYFVTVRSENGTTVQKLIKN